MKLVIHEDLNIRQPPVTGCSTHLDVEGTAAPGEELLPGASLGAAGLLGFGGRAFGLDEADLETASGSQSERSVQQRWQFLGSGGFNSSHFTHHQKS